MIPQVIHYCWFGEKKLPESALYCINSWRKYFPDYEIKEWNEKNFDVECCPYIKEAYEAKKWAFVSDYVRFKILYEQGGLYFDTDVEVICEMTDLIQKGPFMGCEQGDISEAPNVDKHSCLINPGLGLAATPGLLAYKDMLTFYENRYFKKADGRIDTTTIVDYTTEYFLKKGFKGDGKIENIASISIYPPDYFCPLNYYTGEIGITNNTRSIHHYSESWIDKPLKRLNDLKRNMRKFGKIGIFITPVVTWPFKITLVFRNIGLKGVVELLLSKIGYK